MVRNNMLTDASRKMNFNVINARNRYNHLSGGLKTKVKVQEDMGRNLNATQLHSSVEQGDIGSVVMMHKSALPHNIPMRNKSNISPLQSSKRTRSTLR